MASQLKGSKPGRSAVPHGDKFGNLGRENRAKELYSRIDASGYPRDYPC